MDRTRLPKVGDFMIMDVVPPGLSRSRRDEDRALLKQYPEFEDTIKAASYGRLDEIKHRDAEIQRRLEVIKAGLDAFGKRK